MLFFFRKKSIVDWEVKIDCIVLKRQNKNDNDYTNLVVA